MTDDPKGMTRWDDDGIRVGGTSPGAAWAGPSPGATQPGGDDSPKRPYADGDELEAMVDAMSERHDQGPSVANPSVSAEAELE